MKNFGNENKNKENVLFFDYNKKFCLFYFIL